MARRKTTTPTIVELEFLEVIWSAGEVTADDVQRALAARERELSDGSVRKVLSILVDKGHLTRRREGRVFFYKPTEEPQHTKANIVRDVLERVFRGSAPRLVASLFESHKITRRELDEIKAVIAEHEKERRR